MNLIHGLRYSITRVTRMIRLRFFSVIRTLFSFFQYRVFVLYKHAFIFSYIHTHTYRGMVGTSRNFGSTMVQPRKTDTTRRRQCRSPPPFPLSCVFITNNESFQATPPPPPVCTRYLRSLGKPLELSHALQVLVAQLGQRATLNVSLVLADPDHVLSEAVGGAAVREAEPQGLERRGKVANL